MEIYGRIRRAVLVEGKSERAVASEFGVARETVCKMLRYAVPPGYRRKEPPKRPKLGPWLGVIDTILDDDKNHPKKKRYTAKRIFERLRAEHAYTGGYTIVKDYVRQHTLRHQEMFAPLRHAPGEASGRLRRGAGDHGWRGAGRPTTSQSTCRTPTTASCGRFRRRRRRPFWRGTFRLSPISTAFPPRFCTTTRNWRWLGFWAMARGRRHGLRTGP